MNVPITKPELGPEESEAIAQVLASGWVSQGPKVAEFEAAFAVKVGAKFAVATTSWTTATFLLLKHYGVGPGDEVIVPSLSFIATANVVRHVGATPVFCDVDRATLNMSPASVEALLTPATKIIMPVHQLGLPCDLQAMYAIADRHRIQVIEDSACAIGSKYKQSYIGAPGTGAFSLHPRKVITTGEGGMVTTNDPAVAASLRLLRAHGMSVDDLKRHQANQVMIETYTESGYNYRMTDIQAAMGLVQLAKLDRIVERRQQVAQVYNQALQNIPWLHIPTVPEGVSFNYQSYAIRLDATAPIGQIAFMQSLLDKGITTRRGVMAAHLEPCYQGSQQAPLPETEFCTHHTVLLPLYPSMTESEQNYVIEAIHQLL